MKPQMINVPLSLLLTLSSLPFFLHPVSSICVPRTSHYPLFSNQTISKPLSRPPPSPPSPTTAVAAAVKSVSSGILDALADLCSHTDHKDICVSTVESALPSSGSLDATTLLIMQLDALKPKVEAAAAKVSKLLSNPTTDEKTKLRLQVCQENYDNALDDIEDCRSASETQDTATLRVTLSALMDHPLTCEDAFNEFQATSPLQTEDLELKDIGANLLTLSYLALPDKQ